MQRVRLNKQPLQLHAIQQGTQGRDLIARIGSVGVLSDGHTEVVGVKTHLRNEPRCAARAVIDRPPQRLNIAN
jgi:hypothetical protein